MHVFIYTERLFTWNGEEHDTSRTRSTLSATIKLKEEGKTGNQRDQCVEDDEAFSERFVWQDAHKADQAQEEEFHAEESGATPTGSSARGESGQLDGHGPPGTEPDQRARAISNCCKTSTRSQAHHRCRPSVRLSSLKAISISQRRAYKRATWGKGKRAGSSTLVTYWKSCSPCRYCTRRTRYGYWLER